MTAMSMSTSPSSPKAPIIISFDGNIGSGKSSIVQYFKNNFQLFCDSNLEGANKLRICFLPEPVSEWESIRDSSTGKNIIEKFYEDNKGYAFAFQMMAYISRLSLFKKAIAQKYDIIITERSMYTDRNVFAKMLFSSGDISSIEYQVYNKWFTEFTDILKNIKIVYIKTSPEICEKRIVKRGRSGENIPLSYLQECSRYHDNWLNNPDLIENGSVLIVDGDPEINITQFINNPVYDELIKKVYNFMIN
jgi:deoxyadenosine/deoxycytidine kinase